MMKSPTYSDADSDEAAVKLEEMLNRISKETEERKLIEEASYISTGAIVDCL
jgi:hypothetical protein